MNAEQGMTGGRGGWNRVKGEQSKGEQSKGSRGTGILLTWYRHQELRLGGTGKGCVSKYRPSERQDQGYEKATRVEYGVASTPAEEAKI